MCYVYFCCICVMCCLRFLCRRLVNVLNDYVCLTVSGYAFWYCFHVCALCVLIGMLLLCVLFYYAVCCTFCAFLRLCLCYVMLLPGLCMYDVLKIWVWLVLCVFPCGCFMFSCCVMCVCVGVFMFALCLHKRIVDCLLLLVVMFLIMAFWRNDMLVVNRSVNVAPNATAKQMITCKHDDLREDQPRRGPHPWSSWSSANAPTSADRAASAWTA